MIDDRLLRVQETAQRGAGDSPAGLTPREAADLEELSSLVDGRRGLDDIDDEILERLVAAFGLHGLTEALRP
ncbi:MAG: hypothetical protein V2A76_13230 [Planctomycetota bacterium]